MFQPAAVAMPPFGDPVVFLVLAPLGVSRLVLALWLIRKGPRARANMLNETE